MAVDLGKQYGPLPLGAWLVVVAGGLGIAWYTRRAGTSEPVVVEDTSATPGVGVGAPQNWTPIVGTQPATETAPATNEEWGQRVYRWGLANNYPPELVDSAVRKYLAGAKLSVGENAFIALALVRVGPPPQALPPVENEPPPSGEPPPSTGYKGPARRKDPPEGQSTWGRRGKGWVDRAPHSNATATYRGGYTNVAPAGSATEKLHIAAMVAKNATMGIAYRQGGPWYFPTLLNDNGTWVA